MDHVVVGVGYTATHWHMRNSWGSRWGQGGYFSKARGDKQVAPNVWYIDASKVVEEREE